MTLPRISYTEARRLVDIVIDEKGPEYVYTEETRYDDDGYEYTAPRYFHADGSPGCIVGHVLALRGIDPAGVSEGETPDCQPWTLTDTTQAFFRELQGQQDSGHPWGEARDVALASGDYAERNPLPTPRRPFTP